MRTRTSIAIVVVFLSLSGLGCSSESNPWCKRDPLPVESFRWQLQQIEGMPAVPAVGDEQAAYFQLDPSANRVTGYAGVNQFNGSYELKGRELKFSPAAMTRQAGPEPTMRQEAAFGSVLTNTAGWRPYGDNTIVLLDGGGIPLARFTRGAATDVK